MSGFRIVEPLFIEIDTVTSTFVTEISSRAIAELTPIVTVSMTLALVFYGLLVIRGAVDMPVMDFLGRVVRIGLITSVGLAGGLYQTDIAELIRTIPDALALALISDASTGTTAASLIDEAAGQGFQYAAAAIDKSSFMRRDGFAYAMFGVLIIVITAAMTAIGGGFILLAKVALAILAGLGPFFILALLFRPTSRFFELWVGQILNYTLTIVLFSAVFGFMMNLFGIYMADARFDGEQSVAYSLGGAVILGIVSCLLLLQLPSIASGLASGVGIGYFWELRSLRTGAGAVSKATGLNAAGRAVGRGIGAAGASAGRGAMNVGRAAAGYFKGRKSS